MDRYEYESFSYPDTMWRSVVTTTSRQQIGIKEAYLNNRSGTNTQLALCTKFMKADWKMYGYGNIAANTVGTDYTPDIQSGTTVNLSPLTAGAGVILASKRKFGAILMTIVNSSDADCGHVFKYYDGSTQVTFVPNIHTPSTYLAGNSGVVFMPPPDWQKGCTAAVDANGYLTNYYCIRIVNSTATDTSVTIKDLYVGRTLVSVDEVATKDYLTFNPKKEILLQPGEGVVPYFPVVNSANQGGVGYIIVGF
jgi:hypothetical protein